MIQNGGIGQLNPRCVHTAGNHGNPCLSPMLYPNMVHSYDKAAVYRVIGYSTQVEGVRRGEDKGGKEG